MIVHSLGHCKATPKELELFWNLMNATSVCKVLDEVDSSGVQWMLKKLKWRSPPTCQVVDAASSGEESTSAGSSDALRVGANSGTVDQRSVQLQLFWLKDVQGFSIGESL